VYAFVSVRGGSEKVRPLLWKNGISEKIERGGVEGEEAR